MINLDNRRELVCGGRPAEGLKYLGSIAIMVFPVFEHNPISFGPSPSHFILIPTSEKLLYAYNMISLLKLYIFAYLSENIHVLLVMRYRGRDYQNHILSQVSIKLSVATAFIVLNETQAVLNLGNDTGTKFICTFICYYTRLEVILFLSAFKLNKDKIKQ